MHNYIKLKYGCHLVNTQYMSPPPQNDLANQ